MAGMALKGLAATFSSNQQPAAPGHKRWSRPWSPTLPNLRSQECVEDKADSRRFLSALFSEGLTVMGNQSPAKSLSLSQCSAGRVSPWVSPELCQSRWGILGEWLDVLPILVHQFSSSLASELREMWLVSEYKRAPVARASTCLFLAVPWCCVTGGTVTSQPLPFYKGLTLQVTHRECQPWLPAWLNTRRHRESHRVTCARVV